MWMSAYFRHPTSDILPAASFRSGCQALSARGKNTGVMLWRMDTFTMEAIGWVRSPHAATSSIPKGPAAKHTAEGVLEIRPDLEAGLTDIDGFSHLYVIWAFHRAEGYDLLTITPNDDQPHGLFATRTPRRPNPIALSVVELLRREAHRLHVRGVDMLDGTPILDIKPYLSNVPDERLKRGWLAEAEERRSRNAQ